MLYILAIGDLNLVAKCSDVSGVFSKNSTGVLCTKVVLERLIAAVGIVECTSNHSSLLSAILWF